MKGKIMSFWLRNVKLKNNVGEQNINDTKKNKGQRENKGKVEGEKKMKKNQKKKEALKDFH